MSMKFRDAMRRKSSGEGGFTLIELLVVVLILGILSGIVVVAVSNARIQAVNKACIANQVVLMKALDSYYADPENTAGYPGGRSTGTFTVAELKDGVTISTVPYAALIPKYLHNMPPYAEAFPVAAGTTKYPTASDYYLKASFLANGSIQITNNLGNDAAGNARCPALG